MTATKLPDYAHHSAAEDENRRGAHRSRTRTVSAVLPVIAGVAVVLLSIGALSVVIGNHRSGAGDSSTSGHALTEDNSTGSNSTEESSTDATAKPTASADTDETPASNGSAATADTSVEVVILNSLSVNGLAGRYRSKLEDKGWTISLVDDAKSRNLSVSKIYYEDADMLGTARAVRKTIGGIGELTENATVYPGRVTVVLGQDAQ
ncbi:LytR C-terminal domain-containing protein [Kineosporia mesophila]|uniref:LytR C-terminal domain-containing protein n=1 Tax=Kineosporia mesophila TaxID=566012 RepID=UPI001E5713D9|nr:LytR C-terminal domain-containing protein [Kineosporia mesophila]